MREYWYFIPLVGIVFILMALQITEYSINDYSLIPDKTMNLKDIKEIKITGLNVNIKFDPEATQIYYPSKILIKKRDKELILNSGSRNRYLEIIIGTKYTYENIEINGLNITLNGNVNSNIAEISGTNIILKNTFTFIGNTLNIDGTSIRINGNIFAKNLNVDSVSLIIDIKAKMLKNINLDSISISGNIFFLDTWNDSRNIKINSISENITVKMNKNNTGKINSNKNIQIIKY
ncbi:hypothetical protein SAMN02745164_00093 [Marinitoga hydrogenitolerans DSM 16785]|uniref:Uncharacterized protein n=1 Tax=Marinitoga hydrogenitolerans (strain DSM 16785 / JCM 12826 / AT1271) TaxID=1122195 RepID=A0A1M4S6V5_MARH1|nr:hypothetical protein [Marinitoga hydrogenitolerans]SHE27920.1 hypothetical protein SAMN02745164_00093 [Marinitoga hydrogenitolerans DSM 16785]